jgi:phosphoglycolate phosphatase-like HAD superfamily hydrolase
MIGVHLRRGPWGIMHAMHPEAASATHRIDSLAELPGLLS